uniref:Cell division cycle 6 homolog (S. cerevisiae) n=1 Tax=Oryzias melastigma TaxID=30732 RepID=A0A3B3C5Z2_ORYME
MPSTRSQGAAQPTLQFPRRKSCRTSQKTQLASPSEPESITPSHMSPRRPAAPALSPRRLPAFSPKQNQQCSVQPLLSPRRPPTPPSSPPLQTRLPLSPRKRTGEIRVVILNRSSSSDSRLQSVKRALHTAIPERLLSREAEQASIRRFLQEKVLQSRPGSLYISGAPGTGKTACLNCVLQEMKGELSGVQTVMVNCMSLRSSHAIFPLLASKLQASGGQSGLQRFLTGSGPTVLLVLDEMDQLDSKAQDVLYTIFEWPFLPKSRLCLIGIANALDLTDRILPRLQARVLCRPLLLHFAPYSRDELTAIVKDRLAQVSAEAVLDASAVQFCARKVSAVSGDARKALDICRYVRWFVHVARSVLGPDLQFVLVSGGRWRWSNRTRGRRNWSPKRKVQVSKHLKLQKMSVPN